MTKTHPLMGEPVFDERWEGKVYSKGRPRFSGNHAFTPPNTRKFEKAIRNWMIGYSDDAVAYPCSVFITLHDPEPKSGTKWQKYLVRERLVYSRVGDLDNRAKSILDAANDILFIDDSQVVELHICRTYSANEGFSICVQRAGYSAVELDKMKEGWDGKQ